MIKKIDPNACVGVKLCASQRETCEEVCPTDVIRIDERLDRPVIQYLKDCLSCFNCELACPTNAVDVSPLFRPKFSSWRTLEQVLVED